MAMDRVATRAKIRERCLNLAMWCKDRGLSYVSAHSFIYRDTNKLETRNQMAVVEALKADGLYVEETNEDQAA